MSEASGLISETVVKKIDVERWKKQAENMIGIFFLS